jgi:ribose transport system substrate-binding protein
VLACRYLAEKMRGQGVVVIQNGPPVSSVWDRVAGCRRSLAAFPKIRLLSYQESGLASSWGGKRLMERHLRRYPEINGVFACNDRQALGAEQAARAAGRKEVMIAGVDGSPDIEKALRGQNQIVASASQAPYAIGVEAVKLGRQLRDSPKSKPRTVVVPVQLITRANIGAYQGWQSQLPSAPAAAP